MARTVVDDMRVLQYTPQEAIGLLAMLIGMARVACPLDGTQEQCAIDCLYALGRAAHMESAEVERAIGEQGLPKAVRR